VLRHKEIKIGNFTNLMQVFMILV